MEYQEQIIREAKEVGNGAHVFVPREWAGEEIILIRKPKKSYRKRIFEALSDYLGEIKGLYLYGSYARGEENKDSDIDIMIISNKRLDIKIKGFEVICLMEDDISKAIKISPLLVYSALAEAKALINSGLLDELRGRYKPKLNDFKEYLKETRNIIEINKEYPDPYSLILRLRGVYLIKLLLKGGRYTHKNFKNYILENCRNLDYNAVYNAYEKYKHSSKTIDVKNEDLIKLIELLEREVKSLIE